MVPEKKDDKKVPPESVPAEHDQQNESAPASDGAEHYPLAAVDFEVLKQVAEEKKLKKQERSAEKKRQADEDKFNRDYKERMLVGLESQQKLVAQL